MIMTDCPYPSKASMEAAMYWAARLHGPLNRSPRWAACVSATERGGQVQERSDEKEPQP